MENTTIGIIILIILGLLVIVFSYKVYITKDEQVKEDEVKEGGELEVLISDPLLAFLEEKGCVDEFKSNVIKDYQDNYLDRFDKSTYNNVFTNIVSSFSWKNTPEGVPYWDKLDREFYRRVNDK